MKCKKEQDNQIAWWQEVASRQARGELTASMLRHMGGTEVARSELLVYQKEDTPITPHWKRRDLAATNRLCSLSRITIPCSLYFTSSFWSMSKVSLLISHFQRMRFPKNMGCLFPPVADCRVTGAHTKLALSLSLSLTAGSLMQSPSDFWMLQIIFFPWECALIYLQKL